MDDSSPEMQRRVALAFEQIEPKSEFFGCKVATGTDPLVVRIYARTRGHPIMPIPFWIFHFDSTTGTLSSPSEEERSRYTIQNYK